MTYSQPLPKYVLDSTYSPSSRSYISCPSPSTFSDQFQSYLRCCLRGCSPQYAPSKTTLSSHCAFFFFSQCWRGPRVVILPLPKAASFSFPLPKLLVTTSWGGWSQGWRRGQGQTQEQVRLCPVTTADVSADRLPPSSWRPSCAQVVAQPCNSALWPQVPPVASGSGGALHSKPSSSLPFLLFLILSCCCSVANSQRVSLGPHGL